MIIPFINADRPRKQRESRLAYLAAQRAHKTLVRSPELVRESMGRAA